MCGGGCCTGGARVGATVVRCVCVCGNGSKSLQSFDQ